MSGKLRVVLVPAFLLTTAGTAAAAQQPDVVAFEHVTVIPMDREGTLTDQTVIVRSGRIAAVGATGAMTTPPGATVIDGRGKFLMPGLAEMHGHIPPNPDAPRAYVDRILFLFLANGITTVRGMLGAPQHLALRNEIATGKRAGPRLFTSGPSINGNSVPTIDAARKAVTAQAASGYDLLKLHPGLSLDVFNAVVDYATRDGILFAGHVSQAVGVERAIAAGQSSIEHLDGYVEALAGATPGSAQNSVFFGINLVDRVDESRIPELVRQTREHDVWNTPTQILFENGFLTEPREELEKRPELRYMPENVVQGWLRAAAQRQQNPNMTPDRVRKLIAVRRAIIKELSNQDAGILLGADTPQIFNVPGFATINELVTLVKSGLTPYQALKAGTVNPARYFGLERSFGTVEAGKRADLLLLDANPLEKIENVRQRAGVMAAGRWFPKATIEAKLQALAR